MMKTKSIILSALLLIGVGAFTTSCEDMFTAENKLVQTDLAPRDTVYQIMGIVQNMQKIADRTVILGEVRADLVDINSQTPIDLQAVADNAVTIDNAYNNPTDYYAVINSCNTYLAYVDTALLSKGEQYYRNEIIAAKCFRAWTYLELAKIYGKVPFVTEPVITASDADNIVEEFNKAGSNGADMLQITSYFIKDLERYSYLDENRGLLPSYGQSYITQYFIPVRLMLAELYLYRGAFTRNEADYREAVRYYHDFL
ncbi:MAG: RagB/SusD family nutrient uptake outer membrane protein, partial [Bacteroidaceae bacterium]|nr:RagB/SusD family nutrient uptake outer membrane protein [Bacteroidaceae bacterium]